MFDANAKVFNNEALLPEMQEQSALEVALECHEINQWAKVTAKAMQKNCTLFRASGLGLMMIESFADLATVRELNMSMNNLNMLPTDFSTSMTLLTSLSLNNNEFTEFPRQILSLTSLKSLNLQDNAIEAIPQGISALERLESLFLGNCSLRSLPVTLGNLKQLRNLQLQQNLFRMLPSSIGQWDNLQQLYLHHCRLQSLPGNVGGMKKLAVLSLQGNDLKSLPATMQNLTSLWSLDISNNHLENLPGLPRSLSSISFKGNPFSSVPNYSGDKGSAWMLSYAHLRCHGAIETAASSLQMDFSCLLGDAEFTDLDCLLPESGERVAVHYTLIKVRQSRVDVNELFESEAPIKDADGRYLWTVRRGITSKHLMSVLRFLYSGSREQMEALSLSLSASMTMGVNTVEDEENFVADVQKIGLETELADGELRVQGRSFPIHKFVLIARCLPMARMLSSGFKEASQSAVELFDESPQAFEAVLKFIYTDNVKVTGDTFQDLLMSASKWQLPRLVNLCEDFIVRSVEKEMGLLLALFELADTLTTCPQLRSWCKEQVKQSSDTVFSTMEGFLNLPLHLQSELLLEDMSSDGKQVLKQTRSIKKTSYAAIDDRAVQEVDFHGAEVFLNCADYCAISEEENSAGKAEFVDSLAARLWESDEVEDKNSQVSFILKYLTPALKYVNVDAPDHFVDTPSPVKLVALLKKLFDWLSESAAFRAAISTDGKRYEERPKIPSFSAYLFNDLGVQCSADSPFASLEMDKQAALVAYFQPQLLPFHLPKNFNEKSIGQLDLLVESLSKKYLRCMWLNPVELCPPISFRSFYLRNFESVGEDYKLMVPFIVTMMQQYALEWPPTPADWPIYHAYQACQTPSFTGAESLYETIRKLFGQCRTAVQWTRGATALPVVEKNDLIKETPFVFGEMEETESNDSFSFKTPPIILAPSPNIAFADTPPADATTDASSPFDSGSSSPSSVFQTGSTSPSSYSSHSRRRPSPSRGGKKK